MRLHPSPGWGCYVLPPSTYHLPAPSGYDSAHQLPKRGDAMKDRRKKPASGGMGLREFLKASLATGAALAAPVVFTRGAFAQERVLKLVHWKHFVPDYDK